MMHRLSQRNRDTVPLHHKETLQIMRFMADLIRLDIDHQPLRSSPSALDELSAVRDQLVNCKQAIMIYGSDFVRKGPEVQRHFELTMALTSLLIELKLRNVGQATREIPMVEIESIRRMVNGLDECRKRVVFY